MLIIPPPKFRKRRRRKNRPGPAVEPPALTRITGVYRGIASTLWVQFSTPVSVEGSGVGSWVLMDVHWGEMIPTGVTQIDDNTVQFAFEAESYGGTLGYSDGNTGAVLSAFGFPESDQGTYQPV